MTHSKAKRLLTQQALGSKRQRQKAVEAALGLGMPLHEIEQYLDWLDAARPQAAPDTPPRKEAPDAAPAREAPAPKVAARKKARRIPAK